MTEEIKRKNSRKSRETEKEFYREAWNMKIGEWGRTYQWYTDRSLLENRTGAGAVRVSREASHSDIPGDGKPHHGVRRGDVGDTTRLESVTQVTSM